MTVFFAFSAGWWLSKSVRKGGDLFDVCLAAAFAVATVLKMAGRI